MFSVQELLVIQSLIAQKKSELVRTGFIDLFKDEYQCLCSMEQKLSTNLINEKILPKEDILKLLKENLKLQAVKLVKDVLACSLLEAKRIVEKIQLEG